MEQRYLSETMQAQRQWSDIFKVLKEKQNHLGTGDTLLCKVV